MRQRRDTSFDEVLQRDDYIYRRDVRLELDSQLCKFGVQRHSPEKWMLILQEEMGEAAETLLTPGPWEDYEAELVQVAAVAITALESYYAMDPKRLKALERRMKAGEES